MSELTLAVIGAGYWGPNLVRSFASLEGVRVKYICDLDQKRLERLRKDYPYAISLSNHLNLLNDKNLDAVVVSTPLSTHHNIARDVLYSGKHVFIEKPMANSVDHCVELIRLAEERKKVLMIGHVYEYHPAIKHLKALIKRGDLGDLYFMKAERSGLSPVRPDGNPGFDLGAHETGLLSSLFDEKPAMVSAVGSCYLKKGNKIEDAMQISIRDGNENVFAFIHVNWIATSRTKLMEIYGSKGSATFTESLQGVVQSDPLVICERDVSYEPSNIPSDTYKCQINLGDKHVPNIIMVEPLKKECEHFIDCIRNDKKPLTDGEYGLKVVKVLVAAQKSMENDSKFVNVE